MTPCFECDAPADHDHHVVPSTLGGTRTIPLCGACHTKVHGASLDLTTLVRAGVRRRIADGFYHGRPPYGKLVGPDGKLAPHPDEEKVVAKILDLFIAGNNYSVIARYLSVSGVPSRHGTEWSRNVIRKIVNRAIPSTAAGHACSDNHKILTE